MSSGTLIGSCRQFVNTYLQALWLLAKSDAQALVKLEEQNRHYDLLLFAAGEQIKQLEAIALFLAS